MELLLNTDLVLAETPVWDGRIKRWYFTDLFTGDILGYNTESGELMKWSTGELIGSAVPTNDPGKLLCVIKSGIYIFDLKTGDKELVANPNNNENNRYNDSRVDKAGRIFTSTVSVLYGTEEYTPDKKGSFYMVDTDGSVKVIEQEINQYNAIVWNGDDTKMMVVDTYNKQLVCYDYDISQGVVGEGKAVIEFDGMPDGMSIDREDNIYVCQWNGKISVWDMNFNFVKDIPVPVSNVCCGGFGGEDMKDFLVATSKFALSEEQLLQQKGAGGIFIYRNDIPGKGDYFFNEI